MPSAGEIERQAEAIVEQAGDVASRTGKNILTIAKDMMADLRRK